ncbi:MAG: hypothetical protein PHD65_08200 [Gallionella sp.]|nr:hypothetical protein [Gallionella sp.]
MNSSGIPGQQGSAGGEDKRIHAHLRVVFETACQITAPFFDPAQGWGGKPLTLYARQALHEKYPDLTQQDVALLFSAVQRFHRDSANK